MEEHELVVVVHVLDIVVVVLELVVLRVLAVDEVELYVLEHVDVEHVVVEHVVVELVVVCPISSYICSIVQVFVSPLWIISISSCQWGTTFSY